MKHSIQCWYEFDSSRCFCCITALCNFIIWMMSISSLLLIIGSEIDWNAHACLEFWVQADLSSSRLICILTPTAIYNILIYQHPRTFIERIKRSAWMRWESFKWLLSNILPLEFVWFFPRVSDLFNTFGVQNPTDQMRNALLSKFGIRMLLTIPLEKSTRSIFVRNKWQGCVHQSIIDVVIAQRHGNKHLSNRNKIPNILLQIPKP